MEIPDSDEETEREERDPPDASQHTIQLNGRTKPPISTTHFIDRILTQLNDTITIDTQQQHAGHNQNPLSTFSTSQKTSQTKPLMLTLHCLFPNELLLALDVLDRGLVRRLVTLQDDQDDPDGQENHKDEDDPMTGTGLSDLAPSSQTRKISEKEAIFQVISASASASASTSTTRQPDKDKGYEVRLQAWNCTCPTFALCVFRDLHLHSDSDSDSDHDHDLVLEPDPKSKSRSDGDGALYDYRFGGTLTRGSTGLSLPVCKHLLACMLLVRCPRLFGTGHSTLVTAEELAGWCAGWGY